LNPPPVTQPVTTSDCEKTPTPKLQRPPVTTANQWSLHIIKRKIKTSQRQYSSFTKHCRRHCGLFTAILRRKKPCAPLGRGGFCSLSCGKKPRSDNDNV